MAATVICICMRLCGQMANGGAARQLAWLTVFNACAGLKLTQTHRPPGTGTANMWKRTAFRRVCCRWSIFSGPQCLRRTVELVVRLHPMADKRAQVKTKSECIKYGCASCSRTDIFCLLQSLLAQRLHLCQASGTHVLVNLLTEKRIWKCKQENPWHRAEHLSQEAEQASPERHVLCRAWPCLHRF
jgi:hypothetical protein